MMSSTILTSSPPNKSNRISTPSTNPRICPACRNPVSTTHNRSPHNSRPGSALPICKCNPNNPKPPLAEGASGRIQMRRQRERAWVYEPYPGAKESDIYAEPPKTGTAAFSVQTMGAGKERERQEVSVQGVEVVSQEGQEDDDGFEDVDLAGEEVKKAVEEQEEEGGNEGSVADSREGSDDDLMDDGFVIVENYEGMREEAMGGAQGSRVPGYWRLFRAVARKLGW